MPFKKGREAEEKFDHNPNKLLKTKKTIQISPLSTDFYTEWR